MRVTFLVLMMSALSASDISLPELQFLVERMSFAECQHLADALRVDSMASNVEGVTCLDELIRLNYALKNEGPNIARGVFKHKLNEIGRRDLAQWLSIVKDPEVLVLSQSKNGAEEEQVPIEGKTGPLETSKRSPTSWCGIAVTIALLYTGSLLVWLTVRVVLCKMKKHFRDKGGYLYYQAPPQWPPNAQQWSHPSQQWSPPGQKLSPLRQQPPREQWTPHPQAVHSQHNYHPQPTTSSSQPHMAHYGNKS